MPAAKKITIQESQEWVRRALLGFNREELGRLDEILNGPDSLTFIDGFRPESIPLTKKSTAAKKTKTSESLVEIANKPWNPCLCDARCTKKNGGVRYPSQCSVAVKRSDGETCVLCTNHMEKSKKKKGLEYGLYNGVRPDEYANGSPIVWFDSDPTLISAKKSPKKQSGERKPRKCSLCGQEGHTKAKCPMKNEETISPPSPPPSPKKGVMPPHCSETKWDESKGIVMCGGCNSEFTANFLTEKDGIMKCHSCWSIDNILEEDQKKINHEEPLPQDFEPEPEIEADEDTQEMSDGGDALDTTDAELTYDCDSDDGEENIKFPYEGVPYERDSNDDVYDSEFDCVGKWDGENIIWNDGLSKKKHEADRDELSPQPKEDLSSLSMKDLIKKARECGVDQGKLDDARDLDGQERIVAIVQLIKNL